MRTRMTPEGPVESVVRSATTQPEHQDPLFALDELDGAPALSVPMVSVGDVADLDFERARRRFAEGA